MIGDRNEVVVRDAIRRASQLTVSLPAGTGDAHHNGAGIASRAALVPRPRAAAKVTNSTVLRNAPCHHPSHRPSVRGGTPTWTAVPRPAPRITAITLATTTTASR